MAVIVNGDGILTGISSLTTSLTDITSGRGTITGVTTVGTLQLGAGVSISSPRSQNAAIFTNNTEFLTVDDAGRVGIAITNPTTKFDVNGTSKFQDDVTFAGASANITFDKSTDDLIFDDNAQALFGTGSDLKILHDGTDSYLDHSLGSGLLRINAAAGSEIRLTKSGPETLARFIPDGSVELYENNTKRFETSSSGGTLTGDFTVTGNIYGGNHITIQDSDGSSDMLKIGTDEDIRIYHYNNNSYIRQHTDKPLTIGGTSTGQSLYLSPKDGEYAAVFKPNAEVELYYDNSKKFQTGHGGEYGSFQALNGNNGWDGMAVGNSKFVFMGSTSQEAVGIWNDQDNEWMVKCVRNAETQLQYNGSKKFETTSDGATFSGSALFPDNQRIKVGGDASTPDLQIYHDTSNTYLLNSTGNLILKDLTDAVYIQAPQIIFQDETTGENIAKFISDGAVELYHDNAKKLETTSTGINLPGNTDIRLDNGNWTGDATKIQHHNNTLYIQGGSGTYGHMFRDHAGTDRWSILNTGTFFPMQNNAYDIGSSANRVRNIYTNDLHLSNEGHSNDVDGTWGSYTIQEGAEDLFLVNKRNGKKYKFNLTEVS